MTSALFFVRVYDFWRFLPVFTLYRSLFGVFYLYIFDPVIILFVFFNYFLQKVIVFLFRLRYTFFMKFKYLIKNSLPKNVKVPPHAHNCYEFIYYFSAEGEIQYNSDYKSSSEEKLVYTPFKNGAVKSASFTDKSFIIIPPGIVHNEINREKSSVVAIGFDVEPDEKIIIDGLILKPFEDSFNIQSSVNEILEEFFDSPPHSGLMIDSLLTQIIIKISRLLLKTNEQMDFNFIRQYLDEYYMTDVDIDAISKQIGYSKSHFRAVFRKKFNVSFKQYILNKRLEYAESALKNSFLPLHEIAVNSGFEDYYQFSVFFKKKTGLSPKVFRLKYGKAVDENGNDL